MEKQKSLLIVSPEASAHRLELKSMIEDLGAGYTCKASTLRQTLTDDRISEGVTGSIFDCEVLGKHELEQVMSLSTVTDKRPILITAKQIALSSYRQVDTFENIVALQKPFSPKIFQALIERACSGEAFKPGICPRFITDQPVRLMILKNGHLIPTRMRNYSSGGAFLEYRGISIAVGDRVAMALEDVYEASVRRHLQLFAQVVWVRDAKKTGDNLHGVGLQFVTPAQDRLTKVA